MTELQNTVIKMENKMDKDILAVKKDIVKLKTELNKICGRLYKQIANINKTVKNTDRNMNETLDRVKSFESVLSDYFDSDIDDEEETEDWNPYNIDPEDYYDDEND